MDFILQVTGGDHDCVPIAAVISVGKDHAEQLLCLMEEADRMKKVYPELYGIELWDGSPDWIESAGTVNEETAGLLDVLNSENECIEQENIDTEGAEMARVECGTIFVQPDEVYWLAIVKHTDVKVETSALLLKDIEKIAGRKACLKRK